MKLIRLSTTNNDGVFDNEFNANINIKENSKIALTNISLEARQNEIIIDGSNDTIYHQYQSSLGVVPIKLTHGTYTSGNYSELLDEIQQQLNLSVKAVSIQIGMQWEVSVSDLTKKVHLELKKSEANNPLNSWVRKNVTVIANGKNYSYRSSDDSTTTNNNQMYLNTSFCKGGGIFQSRIKNLIYDGVAGTDDKKNGFYFGLTNKKPSDIGTVAIQNLEYGIRASTVTGKYNVVVGGIEYNFNDNPEICNDVSVFKVDTGNPDNNNDVVEVSLNAGIIEIKVHQENNENLIVYSKELPQELYNVDLFPCIIFRGGLDNVILSKIKYTKNPYVYSTGEVVEDVSASGFQPPGQKSTIPNMYLQFGAISLATFLGFDNLRVPVIDFVKGPNYTYSGNNQFVITDVADSFILELLNINLESYDSLSKQRRNILSVIPKTELLNGQVIYEANNLIWLDIGNANPISLRNIKARLLKNDLSKLDISGLAIATILIKDSNE